MGILNVTPDSFSDGGKYASIDAALKKAGEMVDSGAAIIDIGAESTRPGAEIVSESEELARLIPAVEAVHAKFPDVVLSADTYKPAVAAAAVEAGADIINDVVSNISGEYRMAKVAAKLDCGLVITHNNRGSEIKSDFLKNFWIICAEKYTQPWRKGFVRKILYLILESALAKLFPRM